MQPRRVLAAVQGGGAHVPPAFLRSASSISARSKRSLPSIRIRERIVLDLDEKEPSTSKSVQQGPCAVASSQCASTSGASVTGDASSNSRVVLAKGADVWYEKVHSPTLAERKPCPDPPWP